MKQFIVFAVSAVLLALTNGAAVERSNTEVIVVTTDGVRKEDGQLYKSLEPAAAFQQVVSLIPILSVGTISAGDRYIYGNFFQYEGTNLVYMQVFYQGWIPITAIHVTEVGNNLHTVAEIVDGGIGQVYATIRVAAPGGNGFFIRIDMWGR